MSTASVGVRASKPISGIPVPPGAPQGTKALNQLDPRFQFVLYSLAGWATNFGGYDYALGGGYIAYGPARTASTEVGLRAISHISLNWKPSTITTMWEITKTGGQSNIFYYTGAVEGRYGITQNAFIRTINSPPPPDDVFMRTTCQCQSVLGASMSNLTSIRLAFIGYTGVDP